MKLPEWPGSYRLACETPVATDFHRYYYDSGVIARTTYRGVPISKCPLDLWLYQEIIHAVRPTVIIETGTHYGGSALWFRDQLRLYSNLGRVISIDLSTHPQSDPEYQRPPQGNGLRYIYGDSTLEENVQLVRNMVQPYDHVLVVLDSDHRADHVTKELALYAPLVTPESYVIVEDGNVNGNPVVPHHGPGPLEAIRDFLTTDLGSRFETDPVEHTFGLTMNPGGYLRRWR